MGLGSALGGIGKALGFGAASSAAGMMGSAIGSRRQYKYTKKMMQNRHQWEVADLRRAGLNPILSAGAQAPMGNASFIPPGAPDFAGGYEKFKSGKLKKELERKASYETTTAKNLAQQSANALHRDNLLTNYWGTATGDHFIIPMAAANAAGYSTSSATDAVLLPTLMNINNQTTMDPNHTSSSRDMWNSYQRNFKRGARTIRDWMRVPPAPRKK